jgi:hypothetical protein
MATSALGTQANQAREELRRVTVWGSASIIGLASSRCAYGCSAWPAAWSQEPGGGAACTAGGEPRDKVGGSLAVAHSTATQLATQAPNRVVSDVLMRTRTVQEQTESHSIYCCAAVKNPVNRACGIKTRADVRRGGQICAQTEPSQLSDHQTRQDSARAGRGGPWHKRFPGPPGLRNRGARFSASANVGAHGRMTDTGT